jgi:membrane protease YdiL (CAAX protease family)
MEPDETGFSGATGKHAPPPIQLYLLLILLFGYPLLSIVLNMLGSTSPEAIVSKIKQVYLPVLFMQGVIFGAVWIVLRRSGDRFAGIGIDRKDINWSNTVAGLIFFVGAWTLMVIIKGSLAGSGYVPEKEFLHLLPATVAEGAIWILLSAGAALSEEIAFRGYVITRIRIISGSYWAGAILGSAAFSLGHLYQGLAGVLLTFIYGMLFSGLFIARKSVFPCIIAHFLQDSMILVALLVMS